MKSFLRSFIYPIFIISVLFCTVHVPEGDNWETIPDTGFVFGTIKHSIFQMDEFPTCFQTVGLNNVKFSLRAAKKKESHEKQSCVRHNKENGDLEIGTAFVADESYYTGLVQVFVGIPSTGG